jgi:hypothetical protein
VSNIPEASQLAALAKALPGRIQAAALAVSIAERRLAHILTMRATGQVLKASMLAVARMAVARTLRDAEDLQRIQSALPALLGPARESTHAGRIAAVV